MTLIKFEPLRELETLSQRMQRYFEDFPLFGLEHNGGFSPRIDISEDDKNIFVEAEIPGVKKDELKLTLHDNILTIKGEKKKESEKRDKNYYRSERSYGSFQRSITLPVEVDSNKVDAKFDNGTLILKIEKLQPTPVKVKEIELK
jgi:HSP20 family protein